MVNGKDRRFVHVPDGDFEGGGVFEGAEVGEARVHVRIRALDVERVALLPLVVQRLSVGGRNVC